MNKFLRMSLATIFAGVVMCAGTHVKGMNANNVANLTDIQEFIFDVLPNLLEQENLEYSGALKMIRVQLCELYTGSEFVGQNKDASIWNKYIKEIVSKDLLVIPFYFLKANFTNVDPSEIFQELQVIGEDFARLMDNEITQDEFLNNDVVYETITLEPVAESTPVVPVVEDNQPESESATEATAEEINLDAFFAPSLERVKNALEKLNDNQ